MQVNVHALSSASDELHRDQAVALFAVRQDCPALCGLHEITKAYRDVVLEAIKENEL